MKRRGRRLAFATIAFGLVVLGLATYLAWPHLLFWYRFAPLGVNAQGYREYRHRQTGIVFVRLPGGKFWMGAQKDDPNGRNYDLDAQDNEGPVHEVSLSPFLMLGIRLTQPPPTSWGGREFCRAWVPPARPVALSGRTVCPVMPTCVG